MSLADHGGAVELALSAIGLGWADWPEAAESESFDERARLSALLLLLGGRGHVPRRGV